MPDYFGTVIGTTAIGIVQRTGKILHMPDGGMRRSVAGRSVAPPFNFIAEHHFAAIAQRAAFTGRAT